MCEAILCQELNGFDGEVFSSAQRLQPDRNWDAPTQALPNVTSLSPTLQVGACSDERMKARAEALKHRLRFCSC